MKTDDSPTRVHFQFRRSNHYRVIYCDSAWGGITPNGNISMGIASEVMELPTSNIMELLPDGAVGKQIGAEGLAATEPVVRREIEVEVVMSPHTALAMVNWLQDRLKELASRGDSEPSNQSSDS